MRSTVLRLMAARAARSVGQGALVAAFALYLHALAWSAPAIGATLSAALVVGAVLTITIGPLSDRRGRSIQIPRAVGPLVAGLMLHAGMLRAPFFVAAAFQAVYLLLYSRFFRGYGGGGV